MNISNLIRASVVLGAGLEILAVAPAQTYQTFGSGSAVTSIDRQANFDLLDYHHNGTPLSDYSEDSLFIRADGDSLSGWGAAVQPYFNPFHIPMNPETQAFHFPDGGSYGWETIEPTDSARIYALEFLYGNGWTTGDIYGVPWGNSNAYVDWQSLRNGSVVSSGTIGPNPQLQVGTIIGFYDPLGFDQLQMRCRISTSVDPLLQALAMDDLYVQTTPVPEPGSLAILGLGALAIWRRRQKS